MGAVVRLRQAGPRTCLEVVRFDRHGEAGRSGLCSWAALNGDAFGLPGGRWVQGVTALADEGVIAREAVDAVARLVAFGQLVANTDMHDGNLSFQPQAGGRLRLSPVYDMLPMAYRPQVGVELAEVDHVPSLPLPAAEGAWLPAARAALRFWQRAADDARISPGFRARCARNAECVEQAHRRVAG